MARPKKDESGMKVCQRIIEAFWLVLEERRLDKISVERIADAAACNRGSFYYHFDDMQDLAVAAVDDLLTDSENIPGRLFVVTTGSHTISEVFRDKSRCIERLSIVLRRGGYELVESRILPYIEHMWELVLCDEGEKLTRESSFIIAYTVGALLGVIERYGTDLDTTTALEGLFMSEASGVALRNLCSAQKLTFEDALARLGSLRRVERMQPVRPRHPQRER